MSTARDIVTSALEDIGVIGNGQTPLAQDINDGCARLNKMIAQFNQRRWIIYHLLDISCVSTGAQAYTVGLEGNFNVVRPDQIEDGCFFRQTGGSQIPQGDFNNDFNDDFDIQSLPEFQVPPGYFVDYPLRLIEARETYNRIALKGLTTWPSAVYYDARYTLVPSVGNPDILNPQGALFIYPVPQAGAFEIHILVKDVLQNLSDPNTVLAIPPEYEEALEYNLALRLAAKYQIDASKEVAGLARASMATIRSANTQIPTLLYPRALVGQGGRYNVYSDRTY